MAGEKILVVGDDNLFNLLYNVLLNKGYTPLLAGDGKEALDILKSNNNISLTILDNIMPHMDGYTLTTRLRSNSKYGSIPPIIMVSTTNPDIRRAKKMGIDVYILRLSPKFSYRDILMTVYAFPYGKTDVREEGIKAILDKTQPNEAGNIILFQNSSCYIRGLPLETRIS